MDAIQQELVDWIAPRRKERATTTTTMGIAMSQSNQGAVDVQFDASVLSDETDDSSGGYSEKTTITTLPTTVYCEEGDHVIITLYGVDGMLRPTVTGVSGGGDRMMEAIQQGGGGGFDGYFYHVPSGTDGRSPRTCILFGEEDETEDALILTRNHRLEYIDHYGQVAFGADENIGLYMGNWRDYVPDWRKTLWNCLLDYQHINGDDTGPITLDESIYRYNAIEIHYKSDVTWLWGNVDASYIRDDYYGNPVHAITGSVRISLGFYNWAGMLPDDTINATLSLVVPDGATTQTLNAFVRISDDTLTFIGNPGGLKIYKVIGYKNRQ